MAENENKKIIDLEDLVIAKEEIDKNILDSQQVYVGPTPPTDPNYILWIDDTEEPSVPIGDNIGQDIQDLKDNKVDKVSGKSLSSNDYTNEDKQKLSNIEDNANYYEHPESHPAEMITQDASHRFVSDTEKTTWNNAISIASDDSYEPLNVEGGE